MLLVNTKNKDQIRWRFNIKSMRVLSNKPESKKVTNEGALHRFFITYNARESLPNAKKEKKNRRKEVGGGSCALEYKMLEFRGNRKRQ